MPFPFALLIAAAVVQLTADDARRAVDAARPEVEAIRGLRFRRPVPVSTIGDDEAVRYAAGRFERFSSARQLRAQQRTFVLLGLLPAGADIRALYLDVLREHVIDHEKMTEWLDELAARRGDHDAMGRAINELITVFRRHIDSRDRMLQDFLAGL